MRYWGKQIEIDGSYYDTAHGRMMGPTPAQMAQLKAVGSFYQFEGNAAVFEETVQNMVRDIDRNPVGHALIDGINRSSRTVRIIPLTWKEQTTLKRGLCARVVGALSPRGNDSVIWFDPWTFMPNLFTGGTSPYQVLVHELQHSYREVVGRFLPVGPMPRVATSPFPNIEEFFSVLIENMYVSADGKPHLMRNSYVGGTPGGAPPDTVWYKRYANEIDLWCDDHKDLALQLQRQPSFWNPIRVRRAALDGLLTL